MQGNEFINCERFEKPVIEIKMQPGVKGKLSGTEMALRPAVLQNNDQREGTLVFEVYIDEDFVFPDQMTFPGFYLQSASGEWESYRLAANNGAMKMSGTCPACNVLNEDGPFGTLNVGEWTKIEMRLKLNDAQESNGEFILF